MFFHIYYWAVRMHSTINCHDLNGSFKNCISGASDKGVSYNQWHLRYDALFPFYFYNQLGNPLNQMSVGQIHCHLLHGNIEKSANEASPLSAEVLTHTLLTPWNSGSILTLGRSLRTSHGDGDLGDGNPILMVVRVLRCHHCVFCYVFSWQWRVCVGLGSGL